MPSSRERFKHIVDTGIVDIPENEHKCMICMICDRVEKSELDTLRTKNKVLREALESAKKALDPHPCGDTYAGIVLERIKQALKSTEVKS